MLNVFRILSEARAEVVKVIIYAARWQSAHGARDIRQGSRKKGVCCTALLVKLCACRTLLFANYCLLPEASLVIDCNVVV